MKGKLYNLALLVTSLVGYHTWGKDQSAFIFEMERDLIKAFLNDPLSNLHPFTVLPLLGQALLLITLFRKEPGRRLSLIGIACLSLLLFLIFLIGLAAMRLWTILSLLPFVVLAVMAFRYYYAGAAPRSAGRDS